MDVKALPKMQMRGLLGLRRDMLSPEQIKWLQKRLTVRQRGYKKHSGKVVRAFEADDLYVYVPRYFHQTDFWPKIRHWDWIVPPLDYEFDTSGMTLDPEREQTHAFKACVRHLEEHSGCLLIFPTGQGKTLVSLRIAAHFKTPIAILIYADHQIGNFVDHARRALGVPEEDIGYCKAGRCDLGKPVTIVSTQTLLWGDVPEEFTQQVGFLIGDEIHHFGAERWSTVISKFPARYRLGMSADPHRSDGLDPVVRWAFGNPAYAVHRQTGEERRTACMVFTGRFYDLKGYCDWKKNDDPDEDAPKWVTDSPNASKYDKRLMRDEARNAWLITKVQEARAKNRRVLILARHREHVDLLATAYEKTLQEGDQTIVVRFWGRLKKRAKALLPKAHATFATHGIAREAYNNPLLDTLIFATPPGNPQQPAGRLRDRGPADRQPLLIVDPYEDTDYSRRRAERRAGDYEALGIMVKTYQQVIQ